MAARHGDVSQPRAEIRDSSTARIAMDCLKCGHCTSMSEEKLSEFGLAPQASLVLLSRRLICSKCGSKAVQTFRYVEDPDGPSLVPKQQG